VGRLVLFWCLGFSFFGVAWATRRPRLETETQINPTRLSPPTGVDLVHTIVWKHTLLQFWRRKSAILLVAGIVTLAAVTGLTSARWIGKTFPGFFVLENAVVASVSLPQWSVATQHHIYQHAVIAINDHPVTTSAEIYKAVRHLPSGSAITYTLSKDGAISRVTLESQVFTLQDYVLLFGAYLFTGLMVAGAGVGVQQFPVG